ncbi:biosynthetic-type acetolactate synthase large subunit [Streptomyces sp. RGM 3693]|uniref:biosynthetic-type acetolactate synthase large subunit n=1 Tax=Streptomyces sp. RGM 3693 TaxID=3413284 RepID=UPI003D270AA8
MEYTGARIALRTLLAEGVDTLFGIPGGAVLPLYQELHTEPAVRHILVRHEQGAGHAARGYAQAGGRLGVCVATSGPGATNLVTPLMDAFMDSVPVLALTGQVPRHLLGTSAFQETDICAIAAPVTKEAIQVTDAADIAKTLHHATHTALEGRPGPVLVDITKDALQAKAAAHLPCDPRPMPTPLPPGPEEIATLVRVLLDARRPVLYAGGGIVASGAHRALVDLAETVQAPVVTTLMARGTFPDGHPLYLGMPGMHGTVAAVAALQHADLIVALGARFDDRVTGELDTFAPEAVVVHLDIDPREISRKRHADHALVGDLAVVLPLLGARAAAERRAPRTGAWLCRVEDWKRRYPRGYETQPGVLSAQFVMERLAVASGPGTVYTTGVGQHQMWAAQYLRLPGPRSFITSGGAGTMGFAIPAALGARAARPDADIWAVDGDGSFQMTCCELATCAAAGLPVKVAVINNGVLGMVRQWQTLFYDGDHAHTDLGTAHRRPDIVGLAEANGCMGLRCERAEDVDTILAAARAVTGCPVVIDFVVSPDEMVWPMVPPGVPNDDVLVARDLRPTFDPD